MASYLDSLHRSAEHPHKERPGPQGGLGDLVLLRFLVVGGISYLANQLALYLLFERLLGGQGPAWLRLDLHLLLASAIALELSILVRFALNDVWTFRARRSQPFSRRLVQSNLGSLGSPAIALVCVNLLTPLLGISYLIANSIGIALGLVWNWYWSSRVVWRRQPALEAVDSGKGLQ